MISWNGNFPAVCLLAGSLLAILAQVSFAQESREPNIVPAGEAKTPKTKMLELGAKLLQGNVPLKRLTSMTFPPDEGFAGRPDGGYHY